MSSSFEAGLRASVKPYHRISEFDTLASVKTIFSSFIWISFFIIIIHASQQLLHPLMNHFLLRNLNDLPHLLLEYNAHLSLFDLIVHLQT